ncbi:hypothetical protein L195_g023663 [Trifolium pratense]|uniref:Uncharacterized protein n=1 Tax=Trifolium pratense TaxID=57577 RepID=A0A2K3NBI5_TRIPR|nr:hypothetical protein L195_g023663 [Trifolium pratense]
MVIASGVAPFKPLVVYITLNARAKTLDDINDHKVAAEKRLESHDEQLMLIILVVSRYNTQVYCDR